MSLFLIALGLMIIFEGIFYFGFPNQLKQLARKLPEFENAFLRWLGVGLMLLGLVIIYIGKVVIGND